MKYAALYDLAAQRDFLVMLAEHYPKHIAIPKHGFIVPDMDTHPGWDMWTGHPDPAVYAQEFDDLMDDVLSYAEHVVIYSSGKELVSVHGGLHFLDRAYAMGYAHGSKFPFIIDLARDRQIMRKDK